MSERDNKVKPLDLEEERAKRRKLLEVEKIANQKAMDAQLQERESFHYRVLANPNVSEEQKAESAQFVNKLESSRQSEQSSQGLSANQYAAAGTALSTAANSSGSSSGSVIGGVASSAGTGASIGAAAGPKGAAIGAAIGAGVGLAGGLMGASAARKEKAAAARSKSLENIAKIEEDTESKRQAAFSGMVNALRSAFVGG